MRATVMYGAGDVRIETVPDPGRADHRRRSRAAGVLGPSFLCADTWVPVSSSCGGSPNQPWEAVVYIGGGLLLLILIIIILVMVLR